MTTGTFPPHIEHCLELQDDLDRLLIKRVRDGSLKDIVKWSPESPEEIFAWDRLTAPENLDGLKEIVAGIPAGEDSASVALWHRAVADCLRRQMTQRPQHGRVAASQTP